MSDLAEVRRYVEDRLPVFGGREAEGLRDVITAAIRAAGLDYNRVGDIRDGRPYGCADAQWLRRKSAELYWQIPRGRRVLRRGGKLEHISKEDVERLSALHTRARCNALYPRGPWEVQLMDYETADGTRIVRAVGPGYAYSGAEDSDEHAASMAEHDADFVQAAYAKMPTLLDELQRAREALSDLVAALYLDDNPRREAITRSQDLLRQWEMLDD